MSTYRTEQEDFWAGEFGNEYMDRNQGSQSNANNVALFASILAKTRGIYSVLEFGANRGLNLMAIKNLLPESEISAVEINQQAVTELNNLEFVKVYAKSVLEYAVDYQRDFVLTKGLLIHIAPEMLEETYEILYKSSKRYICLAEYYNPICLEVPYRGNQDKLFKRDFAGELMDKYPDLELVDYSFVYHRDNNFSQGDITWFLLEKKKGLD